MVEIKVKFTTALACRGFAGSGALAGTSLTAYKFKIKLTIKILPFRS